MYSKKCSRKYFHACVLENALKNTFSTNFSQFPIFQTNIIIKIPIYKPKETKTKTKISIPQTQHLIMREKERERERVEVAAARKREVEAAARSKKERGSDNELERKREAIVTRLAARSKVPVKVEVVRSSHGGCC